MYHIIALCCICSKSNKTLKILCENDLELLDMLSTQLFDFENLKNELPLYICDICYKDLEKIRVFQKQFNDSVTQMLGYIEQLKYDEYFCIPVIKLDTEEHILNIQKEFIIRNQPKIYLKKVTNEEINKYRPQNQEAYGENSIVSVDNEIIEINDERSFIFEKTNGLKKLITESETTENVKNIWDKLLEVKTKDSHQKNDPLAIVFDKRIAQNQAKTNDKPAIVLPHNRKRVKGRFVKQSNVLDKTKKNLPNCKGKTVGRGKNKRVRGKFAKRGKNKKNRKNCATQSVVSAKNNQEICDGKTTEQGKNKIIRGSNVCATQSNVLDETCATQSNVCDETWSKNNLEICNNKTNEQGKNKRGRVSNVCDETWSENNLEICEYKTIERGKKTIDQSSDVLDEICAKNYLEICEVKTNEQGEIKIFRSSTQSIGLDEPMAQNLEICEKTVERGKNKRIRAATQSNVLDETCANVCATQSNVLDEAKSNQATYGEEINGIGMNKRLRSSNVLTKDNPPPPNILINNIRHKFASIVDKNTNDDGINLDIVKNEPFDDCVIIDESNIKQELLYE